MVNVDIDALIDRVVINGVDVTAYVNERDRWYPVRSKLLASTPADMQAAWAALEGEWRSRSLGRKRVHHPCEHGRRSVLVRSEGGA